MKYVKLLFVCMLLMVLVTGCRKVEITDEMFEKTKNWLNKKDKDGNYINKFQLVIDELHSYRGTSGTGT